MDAALQKPSRPARRPRSRAREIARLRAAFRDVWRGLGRVRGRDTHLRPGELGLAQFELLSELYERGELSAGELAAAARIAPGTVTQMLEHLAQSGHVERARPRRDRRVVVSRLTPLGREQIEAKRSAWQQRWERALEGLSAAQLGAACEVLERLAAMVEEVAPERRCEGPSEAAKEAVQDLGS